MEFTPPSLVVEGGGLSVVSSHSFHSRNAFITSMVTSPPLPPSFFCNCLIRLLVSGRCLSNDEGRSILSIRSSSWRNQPNKSGIQYRDCFCNAGKRFSLAPLSLFPSLKFEERIAVNFLIVSSLHEHEVVVVGSEELLFAVVAYVEVEFAVAPPNREDASSPPPLIRSADSNRLFNSLKDATDCCCWSEPPSPLGGRGRLLRPKLTMLTLSSWGIPCCGGA